MVPSACVWVCMFVCVKGSEYLYITRVPFPGSKARKLQISEWSPAQKIGFQICGVLMQLPSARRSQKGIVENSFGTILRCHLDSPVKVFENEWKSVWNDAFIKQNEACCISKIKQHAKDIFWKSDARQNGYNYVHGRPKGSIFLAKTIIRGVQME